MKDAHVADIAVIDTMQRGHRQSNLEDSTSRGIEQKFLTRTFSNRSGAYTLQLGQDASSKLVKTLLRDPCLMNTSVEIPRRIMGHHDSEEVGHSHEYPEPEDELYWLHQS